MTDTLRLVAYLQRELGDEPFAALIDSTNTAKVRQFAEELVRSVTPPTEMTLGDRTYEILEFSRLEDAEGYTPDVMKERITVMNACRGEDDGRYLLKHQLEIPSTLRRIFFVFIDWRLNRPRCDDTYSFVYWSRGKWVRNWNWLGYYMDGKYRVLRRK